jgi:multiple sugar transport system permease protein
MASIDSNQSSDTRSWYARNKLAVTPWIFLAPAMIFFTVYVIAPIFQSIWISFFEWDGLGAKEWVGMGNYIELLDDDRFYTSLWNNLIWLVLYMLAVPAGLFVALFLNQTVTGMRLYKSMFFFPFVISQVVVGLIFTWFYNPNFGVVGQVWAFFGATPPSILGNEDYVTYGIIVAGLWPQIAYCMILYLTGLNNVAEDQIEAGRVTVVGALRSFDMIAVMTQGGPYGSSNVLAYYMFETALSEYGFRMGYGSAIATVLFLIMLIYISAFLVKMYRDEKGGH